MRPFSSFANRSVLTARQGPAPQSDAIHRPRGSDHASADVADALDLLRRLHVGRNNRPIAETITMLLQAVRAHAGIALWQNGEQALANCQRLIDMARHFERGASSFRAFVESVEADAESADVNEAPIVEEGTEGVRVMTVYKAKGLEFPVVILADPTYKATRDVPSRHIDAGRSLWLEQLCGATPIELREASDLEMKRDRAEAIRIAYVAATRARDLLVVPAGGDQPIEGWFEILGPVLYPPENARRNAKPAPGCPAFGSERVLGRGPTGKPPVGGSVRPGLHTPVPDGAPVVVGPGSSCARSRGAGTVAAPAHPGNRSDGRRGGEPAGLYRVEGGTRGSACQGLSAVAVCPNRYFTRS
jgi:hypothetical protein